jgi:hypothetical protein
MAMWPFNWPNGQGSSEHFSYNFSLFSLGFHGKFVIHENPTVRSSIRLRKRDLRVRIYVFTDCFEVKH